MRYYPFCVIPLTSITFSMNKKLTEHLIHAFPKYLLGFTVLFLLTLYTISWLVDFKQVYIPGITEWKEQFPANLFWLQVFREAGIVENMQWLFLGFSFLICSLITILDKKQTGKIHLGFLLLAIGLFVMLLEDTINLRHQLSYFLSIHFYDGIVGSYEWRTSTFRSLVEISVYGILGLLMMIAFIKIYRDAELSGRGKKYLIFGYLFYGVAATASATRNIGDWYSKAGGRLIEIFQRGGVYDWSAESIMFFQDPLGFWFMDLLLEESFELMGSALFCSAVTILISSVKK